MCVALAPAEFSNTIVYAGEVSALGVHVLGYQNDSQSYPRSPYGPQGYAPGNAMLLHFPAAEPMTERNFLDTSGCPNILQDMESALKPPTVSVGSSYMNAAPASAMPDVVVFTQGIYDVVLARSARFVPDALQQVAPEKRPPLNDAIFSWYDSWFPDWPVALCCFNNVTLSRSQPLLWWYRPRNPDVLFAPALDAHDGSPPELVVDVRVEHVVVFGSDRLTTGHEVRYSHEWAEAMRVYKRPEDRDHIIALHGHQSNIQDILSKFDREIQEYLRKRQQVELVRPYLPARVTGATWSADRSNRLRHPMRGRGATRDAYAPPVTSRKSRKKPCFVGVLVDQLTGTSWYPSR
jgi:hypothetical protein